MGGHQPAQRRLADRGVRAAARGDPRQPLAVRLPRRVRQVARASGLDVGRRDAHDDVPGDRMRAETATWLRESGLDPQAVENLVRVALAEDGESDVTSEPIFDVGTTAVADVVTRRPGVVAGLPVATVVFEELG